MLTWSPNSKRCSTDSFFLLVLTCLLTSVAPKASASINKNIRGQILTEIHGNASPSFEKLLSAWERRYGTGAVPALIDVARDHRATDPDRYVALMGVAKIGGRNSAPLLSPLLRDPSWMIRDGALRALAALDCRDSGAQILPLLKDPALVVRLEAIQSVEKLKPDGVAKALLAVVADSQNYHHGKAQWVPERALDALLHLRTLRAISDSESHAVALRLSALLENRRSPALDDPALKEQIAQTVRALTAAD